MDLVLKLSRRQTVGVPKNVWSGVGYHSRPSHFSTGKKTFYLFPLTFCPPPFLSDKGSGRGSIELRSFLIMFSFLIIFDSVNFASNKHIGDPLRGFTHGDSVPSLITLLTP